MQSDRRSPCPAAAACLHQLPAALLHAHCPACWAPVQAWPPLPAAREERGGLAGQAQSRVETKLACHALPLPGTNSSSSLSLSSLHLTPATAMSRTLLCTAPWRGPARARAIPPRHSRCSPPQRHTPLATCTTTACPGQSSRLGVPAGRWHRTPQLPGALFLLCYSLVPHATVQQQAFHTQAVLAQQATN